MILRQIGEDQARKTNVAKSVEIAKQAIKLDFKDGKSWYTMGNAYMSNYFVNHTSRSQLHDAIKAYKQAVFF